MKSFRAIFRGSRPDATMAAKEELIVTLRKELRDSRSRPTEKTLRFITADAVKRVMTKERVGHLLEGLGFEDQEQLNIVWNHSRQIIAILITIKWNGWPRFKEIFLRELDLLGRPRRGDHQLPFLDLNFLGEDVREDFDEAQYLFRPITIQENRHQIYSEKHRLPFLESREIGYGGFGVVTEESVERKQIKYNNGVVNSKVISMARKVIESTKPGTKSFLTEKRNLEQFKDCLSKNDNIMMSFATFVHGSQFNIILPLANLDLHDFLYGNYPEKSQRCTGFTPRALFEEAWCLSSALNFLHEQLNLRTGPISCAHMDLKPENILIEGLSPSPNGEMVVGRWKISDFGIAIIKPLDAEAHGSRASKEHQLAAPGDVIRDISMKPPRPPGPYQAPEMQPQEGLRVSKSSDMWSFGCIIAMILAFAVGGPEEVKQLHECRKHGHMNDYFYMKEGPAVKPKIIDWLKHDYQREDQNLKEHWQWISECQILVLDLLAIKKEDRPSAEQAGICLLSISKGSGRIPLEKQKLWGASEQEQQTIASISSATDDISSLHSTLSFETDGEHFPPDDMPPPISSFTAPDELRIGQAPFRPPNVTQSLSFIRLATPLNVKKACLSSCGRRAAFLSENEVFLYQLDALDDKLACWKPKSHTKRLTKDTISPIEPFECTEARQWTSIFLAGPFCALASTSKEHIEDMRVELYDLSKLKYPTAQHAKPIHRVEIPEDFKELKLSSEGFILLQFYDRLEVSSSRGQSEISLGQIYAASFSNNGKWLCAWHNEDNRLRWAMWDMKTMKQQAHGMYSSNSPQGRSSALRRILIPFNHHPCFAACDQHGNLSIFRENDRQSCDKDIEGLSAGLVSPSDDAIVLIREKHSVVTRRQKIDVILMTQRDGKLDSKTIGELENTIVTKDCGLALRERDSNTWLLTCHPDGYIATKKLTQ